MDQNSQNQGGFLWNLEQILAYLEFWLLLFLEDVKEITVETPYGAPSDKIALAKIGDKTVAFFT